MKITVNGKRIDSDQTSLMGLARDQEVDPDALIIEHNLKIIPQAEWDTVRLKEGDTVELLSFVGGG